jgi:assimilatory nitrate reductase catalytic subunit
MTGRVFPASATIGSGAVTSFRQIYASGGWDVTVRLDEVNVPEDASLTNAELQTLLAGHRGPAPAGDPTVAPAGTPRLYGGGVFPNPSGRVRLPVVERAELAEAPRPDFPLVLNTGRTVEHWHTRTKTGQVPLLEGLAPEAWVEINPSDAERLRIRTGDVVRVISPRGAIDRVVARVTGIMRAGEVFIPFHYDEACANRLTNDEFDPISREPNYKQCAVRIEPVGVSSPASSAASAPRSRRGRSRRGSRVS